MTVGFSKLPPPSKLPEHVLWTLTKTGRSAEARVRMTPFGPELLFLMWHGDKTVGDEDLLWSRVFRTEDGGGAAPGEAAKHNRREFVALGWIPDPDEYVESLKANG